MTQLIFSDIPPREGGGILLHYLHEPLTIDGWDTIDARTIIAEYEDEWLSDIEVWHRELSIRAGGMTRWWWLLPGSRLVLWPTTTSFELKPILYARAVITLLRCHPEKIIWIIGASRDLCAYLSEWVLNSRGMRTRDFKSIKNSHLTGNATSRLSDTWRNLLKPILILLIYVAFRKRRRVKRAKILVNSLILDPNILEKAGDHFYGRMLDNLPNMSSKDFIWLYNDIRLDQSKTNDILRSTNRQAYLVSDLVRSRDILFALRNALKVSQALKPLQTLLPEFHIEGIPVSSFPKNFHLHLIDRGFPYLEFVYYQLFTRALSQSAAKTVIYPYEEKPLERALLYAAKDSQSAIKTIGFAHAAYSKGHLYIRRARYRDSLGPDRIAVTGEVARRNFNKIGVPLHLITVIGSPRHYYPIKQYELSTKRVKTNVLLLIGYGFELRNFAVMIESCPDLFDNFSLMIRRYPYGWINEQDKAESRIIETGIRYNADSRDLISQIERADIALFESTSAAMEAVLRGKLVVQINLTDTISSNHFCGLDGQKDIEYCDTALQLKESLNRLAGLNSEEYGKLALRQRHLVERLYSPAMPEVLEKLLTDVELPGSAIFLDSHKDNV